MSAVRAAIAGFARADRHDLWPRFTAKQAGVTTAEAREAMLDLTEKGLLDLWYVVLCESGDEVARYKHPERPPYGTRVACDKHADPLWFTLEESDVFLMFSPTDDLRDLTGLAEPLPKVEGAEEHVASAPPALSSRPEDDERVDSSPRYVKQIGLININLGDRFKFKKTGPVNFATRGGEANQTVNPPSGGGADDNQRKKNLSALVLGLGILLAIIAGVTFIYLGADKQIAWKYAGPAAIAAPGLLVATANAIAGHIRS